MARAERPLFVLEDVADVEDGAVIRVLRLLLRHGIGLEFLAEFGVGFPGAVRFGEGNSSLCIDTVRRRGTIREAGSYA